MSLIELILILVVSGVLLYLFNQYVTKIDPKIKQLINIVVIVALVVICLYAFGLLPLDVKVPKLR